MNSPLKRPPGRRAKHRQACLDRGRHEIIDVAVKALELSQRLREKWLTDDDAAKRRILEILGSNYSLDGVSLVATMRKPFRLLAEGLLQTNSREFRGSVELFLDSIAEWEGDLVRLVMTT
jgi:hypothetical protein